MPIVPPTSAPKDSLIESFVNADGSFMSASASDTMTQGPQIPLQRHVDIRTFVTSSISGTTNNQPYPFNQATNAVISGETWTGSGTVGKIGNYSNQSGIQISLASNASLSASCVGPSVDIYTGFDNTSFISLACPIFPYSELNTSQCYVDFTSDPGGNFSNTASTDSLAFSSSITVLQDTDCEIRFPRSLLVKNLALAVSGTGALSITGVRIRLSCKANANSSFTFTCLAIRLCGPNWMVAPVDIDTRHQRLVRPVSRAGTLNRIEFPQSIQGGAITTDWPVLYRNLPGTASPLDIDAQFTFNTGSQTVGADQVRLFLRTTNYAATNQQTLDQMTMAQLDASLQPDEANAQVLVAHSQDSLDTSTQFTLDQETMSQLDASLAPVTQWLSVLMIWGHTTPSLSISDSGGHAYSWTPTLAANTTYTLVVSLRGGGIRAWLWTSDASGAIDSKVHSMMMDTGIIADPSMIRKATGYVGWYAHLEDGDSWVSNIAASYTSYGEYLSDPLRSFTPVNGASVYREGEADLYNVVSVSPAPLGGSVSPVLFNADQGYTIQSTSAYTGIQTNYVWIYDFTNFVASFDLNVPSFPFPPGNSVYAYLVNGASDFVISVPLSYTPGIFNHFDLKAWKTFSPVSPPSGYYSLMILQPTGSTVKWSVKNLTLRQRSYNWHGRASAQDAWGNDEGAWTFFEDSESTIFSQKGNSLQIRGRQMLPSASITGLQIVPQYAGLGRFSWADTAVTSASAPTASFTYSNSGDTFTFRGTGSTASNQVIAYSWAYGDGGEDSGPVVSHTFSSGTYQVRLTVTDTYGVTNSITQMITAP